VGNNKGRIKVNEAMSTEDPAVRHILVREGVLKAVLREQGSLRCKGFVKRVDVEPIIF